MFGRRRRVAQKIWARASDKFAPKIGWGVGDAELHAALTFDQPAIHHGLTGAFDRLSPEHIEAGLRGLRFFGLEIAADIASEARWSTDADRIAYLNQSYRDLDTAVTLMEGIETRLITEPTLFAPVRR